MEKQKNALIVDLHGRFAAVLTEDGQFERIRNKGYEIGQRVQLEQPERRATPAKRRFNMAAFASVAAGFLMLTLGGFAGYRAPAGVVSLDVNPSIEYTINCFDRVLDITAVNEDAQAIVGQLDENALLFRPVDTAVEQTIEALRGSGYFPVETENDVILSVSSYSEPHAERLAQRLEERTAKQADLSVISVSVSKVEVAAAHALGASAGKLYLVERLRASSGGETPFDTEGWLERPVREILQKTQEEQARFGSTAGTQPEQNAPSGLPAPTPSAQPGASAQPDGQPSQSGGPQPQLSPTPRYPRQGNPGGGAKPNPDG